MNKQTLITMIQASTVSLEKATLALGAKATWSPLDKGRTALNQIVECGGFMHIGAMTVSAKAFPTMTRDEMIALRNQAIAENDTVEKGIAALRAGATALTDALSAASDEDLQTAITIPFFGGMEKTLAEFVTMIYWNSTYHEGQINYIETLL